MLTELCKELNNWFEKSIFKGTFKIVDGVLSPVASATGFGMVIPLQENQYFRIIGSVFNDGVWKYSSAGVLELEDEQFEGEIWLLAIPRDVINLADQIDEWRDKYENTDSASMSPYNSESFGGYSYSKSAGSSAGGSGGGANSWSSFFAGSLNRWRKI